MMKKILFQGDSITNACRSYDDDSNMGCGYPTLVAAELGCDTPNEFTFLNRGVNGNRSVDLLARIKSDIINLQPDVMSILIGVNDVWHEFNFHCGVDIENFEVYYDMIITQTKNALPDIKIMILEPFLLNASATADKWEAFRADVEKRAVISQKIAKKHNLKFVPLMQKFDEAAKLAPGDYWTKDGVHPTAAGHYLIKQAWIEAFKTL